MSTNGITTIKTFGELKTSGYTPKSIKDELRDNLRKKLRDGDPVFSGILGYEDSVIPDLERAILSRHNISLLGLRGQAKTRIARQLTGLLDEYVPVVKGSQLNDDPFRPLSHFARTVLAEKGDATEIEWLHRDARYTEKLATPDVSVADLIGDVDPIKAANLKLSYSDERVIHFGLVPRSNRCIFAINELPDLQARIQVALFNILQEGDIQIRGFKLRLPLDIQFVFTANPEDYTNRGSIVTPLKDRIESQILTHYPKSLEISRAITQQEARVSDAQKELVEIYPVVNDLVEQVAIEARKSEYVDQKSGVSARLTISAFENLVSAAERRALRNGELKTTIRLSDFWGIVPAITGKIELVYEGEQEGPALVAQTLIGRAIRSQFLNYFPNPEEFKRASDENPYMLLTRWFQRGNTVDLMHDMPASEYVKTLQRIPGLASIVEKFHTDATPSQKLFLMEFILHGMAEYSLISKQGLESGLQFKDLLSGMLSGIGPDEEEDEDDFY